MVYFAKGYRRTLVFGLMLVLMAGSNAVCLAVDDFDDDSPSAPIALNTALPSNKALHLPQAESPGWSKAKPAQAAGVKARIKARSTHRSETISLPDNIPLRT